LLRRSRYLLAPGVVAEIVRNLVSIDVKPSQIYIYERFRNQMDTVSYDRYVPRESTSSPRRTPATR